MRKGSKTSRKLGFKSKKKIRKLEEIALNCKKWEISKKIKIEKFYFAFAVRLRGSNRTWKPSSRFKIMSAWSLKSFSLRSEWTRKFRKIVERIIFNFNIAYLRPVEENYEKKSNLGILENET